MTRAPAPRPAPVPPAPPAHRPRPPLRPPLLARVAALALLAGLAGCPALHEPRLIAPLEPDEVLRVDTDDGTWIALHHDRPAGPRAGDTPILICHGIASNTHTWALGAGRDLGRYLADRGYDTYLVDLRGHGAAGPATPETTVDTYALHDVPAAIGAALADTGAERAVWIGHSMGGMALVAYLESVGDPPLAGAVTVASPVDWRGDDRMTGLVHTLLRVFSGRGPLPARTLSGIYAPWADAIPMDLDRMVYAPANMGRAELADMMRIGVSPIQGGVRRQFADTLEAGAFVSADGTRDYLRGAPSIQVPFLVIAGRADRLCPPERTVTFFDSLGSEDKTWRVFGLDQGDGADYGHVDLCNGDHAAEDVYPFIADWLDRRLR